MCFHYDIDFLKIYTQIHRKLDLSEVHLHVKSIFGTVWLRVHFFFFSFCIFQMLPNHHQGNSQQLHSAFLKAPTGLWLETMSAICWVRSIWPESSGTGWRKLWPWALSVIVGHPSQGSSMRLTACVWPKDLVPWWPLCPMVAGWSLWGNFTERPYDLNTNCSKTWNKKAHSVYSALPP